MTKTRLKKLRALIKEVEHLKSEIVELVCFPINPVTDTYEDYKTGYPVTKAMSGYGDPDYADLKSRLYGKLNAIQGEIDYMETWLDSLPDAEIRDILRLQYRNGMTQEEIAEELGYNVRTIKRRLEKFWKDVL